MRVIIIKQKDPNLLLNKYKTMFKPIIVIYNFWDQQHHVILTQDAFDWKKIKILTSAL